MASIPQRSFAGGELAPEMYARAEQVKFATGLRTCRNFIVLKHGGVANRPGSTFVAETADSTRRARLVPFIFNAAQTYMLEFGHLYMRVHYYGDQIVETGQSITGITQANPAVVTVTAHGYANGEEVYIDGVGGMTEVNGRQFKVAGAGANTFELQYMDGTAVDATGAGAYTSGGTAYRVYEIVTPYVEDDLASLHFVQSADVVTITSRNHPPHELQRTGHTAWALTPISFQPAIARPQNCTGSGSAGANTYRYRISAVTGETFEESLAGVGPTKSITNITQANPAVVTVASHGYANGDEIFIDQVVGMTDVNGETFVIANVATNTFELVGIDSTSYGAYTSGGVSAFSYAKVVNVVAPSASQPVNLSWDAVSGAAEYYVYRALNDVYGFIGIAGATTFSDTGIQPDVSQTPIRPRNPFEGAGNYPATSAYYQQRQMYAGTDNDPETVFGSQSANYKNFTTRSPLQADDAITFTLAGKQVNEVRHLVDLSGLVALTSGSVIAVLGNADGILVPGEPNPRTPIYHGASTVAPITVGNVMLYIQARGNVVHDLRFEVTSGALGGYVGRDLTIFSAHLLRGRTVLGWGYQEIPESIVWARLDDGALLGLTYVPAHELWGWHRHDTDGLYDSVATAPEGEEDAVYTIVRRTIAGREVRYVERFASRRVTDIAIDAFFVDCGLSYDGRNTDTGHTMTLTGGVTWEVDEPLTLTSSASFFTADDVGNAIVLSDGEDTLHCTIQAYTSPTVVTVLPTKNVPAAFQVVALSTWSRAVDEVGGLWHLEGKIVSILADGNVEPQDTVSGGKVQLQRPYSIVHVGLPIEADIETLDLDIVEEVLTDRRKRVREAVLVVTESRGIYAGPDAAHLVEYKQRSTEPMGTPTQLKTGQVALNVRATWSDHGRIFVRQSDPLPLTILAAIRGGDIGG